MIFDNLFDSPRPAYDRAIKLIEELEHQNSPAVLKGVLKAWFIAEANDVDAAAERHRAQGTD